MVIYNQALESYNPLLSDEKKQKSVLEYTDIYSPVSGIVKELKVTTVGGVLRAE